MYSSSESKVAFASDVFRLLFFVFCLPCFLVHRLRGSNSFPQVSLVVEIRGLLGDRAGDG